MKKIYRYMEIMIISISTIFLLNMCTDNNVEENAVVQINEIVNEIEGNIEETNVVQDVKRDYRTNIKGNNEDVFTLMIYMCGSNLESEYGVASADINEILEADINENINILIQTGGCTDWTNPQISEERTQIFSVKNGQLELAKDDLGLRNMAEPSTLSDFINYSEANYPANRYGLIVWNHGFGTLEGFGQDENFEDDSMAVSNLATALDNSNIYFDFIGFDACFMSTVEVAYALEPFADYLIASAEIEPFAGWYYTNWLNQLSNNTSINTVDLGKIIIDDFVQHNSRGEVPEGAILSIIDLTEIRATYNAVCNMLDEINDCLGNGEYEKISLVRSGAEAYAENLIDHVDIISLAENLNINSSQNVIEAINNCIKYKGKTITMSDVGGLSLYFPYYKMKYFDKFQDNIQKLNLNKEHFEFINNITSAIKDGKIETIGEARKFEEGKEAEINRYNSN